MLEIYTKNKIKFFSNDYKKQLYTNIKYNAYKLTFLVFEKNWLVWCYLSNIWFSNVVTTSSYF